MNSIKMVYIMIDWLQQFRCNSRFCKWTLDLPCQSLIQMHFQLIKCKKFFKIKKDVRSISFSTSNIRSKSIFAIICFIILICSKFPLYYALNLKQKQLFYILTIFGNIT